MLDSELGQRRWKVGLKPRFWLKLFEIIIPVVVCPVFALFNQQAMVHMRKTSLYYNISLQFPYTYTENLTVVIPPNVGLKTFEFDETLQPSAILFVGVMVAAFLSAIMVLVLYLVYQNGEKEQTLAIKYFFIALSVTFLLLASTIFWLVNFVRLKQNVNKVVQDVLKICTNNNDNCVNMFPNYVTLYITTAFAFLLFVLWAVDCFLSYFTAAHTIPEQLSQATLVRNIELTNSTNESTNEG